MIIQHNMMAANTNRQLGRVTNNKAKVSEKLSSGYRINRAADDAAGFSISEKMRSQIRGLNQASMNAQDGISLLQTADGALGEVHSILQRVRELSVQGANDTNVDTDRDAIQEEIDMFTKEIDHIANNTEFNSKKLLDGSCINSGLTQADKDKFIGWLNGSWLNDAANKIESITGWTLESDTTLSVTFSDIGTNYVATMSGWYLGDDLTLDINTNFLSNGMTYNGTDGPTLGGIPADRLITHEMTHGYMFDNVSATAVPDNWFVEGLAEGVHGASDIRYGLYENSGVTDYTNIYQGIQAFDFIGNESSDAVYTVGYLATSYLYNQIEAYNVSHSTGTFKDMMAEMDETDETFRKLVEKYTGEASFSDFIDAFKSSAQTAYNAGSAAFENFLATECGIDINDGKADPLDNSDASSSDVIANTGGEIAPAASTTSITIGSSNITVVWNDENAKNGITLQIGAQSNQSMVIGIDSITSSALGMNGISVSNHTISQNSISKCEDAISKVSNLRSKLGAYQNRLEHVVANLNNASENTQNAESRIRDTDIAEAMVEFSKEGILQQAGQAMLVQANQKPQSILSLLQ